MKELPNPVFPLSLVALPGGHFIELIRQWSASGRDRSLKIGMAVLRQRGAGLSAKTSLHSV